MTESPAIKHSLARLAKAHNALDRLEEAETLDEAESAWADLLMSGNGIFTKLEQGSKINGKASAWYGRIRKIRRDDPLLTYMHHARNSEEHRLDDLTKRMKVGDATITIREPFDPAKLEGVQIRVGTDSSGRVHVSSSDEEVVSTKMYDKPALSLLPVKDRGSNFDPPSAHLGTYLPDQAPLTVGKLFLSYLTQLIDEAKSFGV